MNVTIRQGTTRKVLRLMVLDREGEGMTGLSAASPGARAAYIAEGATAATEMALVEPGSGFTPGGFREVDRAALPGLYELHVPDAVLHGPGHAAVLMLRFAGAEPAVVHIDLVGYDPYDGERLGLTCLSQESRHACLASAFRDVVPAIVAQVQGGGRADG